MSKRADGCRQGLLCSAYLGQPQTTFNVCCVEVFSQVQVRRLENLRIMLYSIIGAVLTVDVE